MKAQHHKGFTLIELIAVIIILGILSTSALPRFLNVKSNANSAVVNGGVDAIRTSATLYKARSLANKIPKADTKTFDGVKGSNYQPWPLNKANFPDYTSPPQIFIGAGLNYKDWAYSFYRKTGAHMNSGIVASPKSRLNKDRPTKDEVINTNCYFLYEWDDSGIPEISSKTTGC